MTTEIDQEKRNKKYNRWARHFPAIVCLTFPLIIAVYVFFDNIYIDKDAKQIISRIELLSKTILIFGSLIPALFFFYVFSVREISMHVIERVLDYIFGKKGINMLKKKNMTFSDDRKEAIRGKIKNDFSIDIPKQGKNRRLFPIKDEFRRKTDEAIDLIRENTRDNHILFEYNCVYGFFRNLAGGLLMNLIVLFVIVKFNISIPDVVKPIVELYKYIMPIMLLTALLFVRTSSYNYSKRLFIVYLNTKVEKKDAYI